MGPIPLLLFNIVLKVQVSVVRKEKEIREMRIGRKDFFKKIIKPDKLLDLIRV